MEEDAPESRMEGPQYVHINFSTQIRELKNEHLWLRRGDAPWHKPVLATLREAKCKNLRQRTDDEWQKRKAKTEENLSTPSRRKKRSDRRREQTFVTRASRRVRKARVASVARASPGGQPKKKMPGGHPGIQMSGATPVAGTTGRQNMLGLLIGPG